mmetsp:Transcript_23247/g.48638  ORF Transcript_23247/g.48638 Transcript_23247/m.48638 type:complete len:87 (+) Transcript_23247:388-648(+)
MYTAVCTYAHTSQACGNMHMNAKTVSSSSFLLPPFVRQLCLSVGRFQVHHLTEGIPDPWKLYDPFKFNGVGGRLLSMGTRFRKGLM